MCISKITIPDSQQVLIPHIEYFLKVAVTQGFVDKPVIEISKVKEFIVESSTNKFVVSNDFDSLTTSRSSVIKSDIGVSYSGLNSFLSASQQVFVNVLTEGKVLDKWSNGSVEHLLDCSNTIEKFDKFRHFSAFIATLSLGFCIDDGLVLSRAFHNVSRETWPEFGDFPLPVFSRKEQEIIKANNGKSIPRKVDVKQLAFYPVVDSVELLESLLNLGVKTAQLRIKSELNNRVKNDIDRAIELGKSNNAQVIINDHWQYALNKGAFGIHLGQEDLVESDFEAICNANAALGLSTHGYYELLKIISLEPSYIALGHIFPTTTKVMPSNPQGIIRLKLYTDLIRQASQTYQRDIPTVAIGGIDLTNAAEVMKAGVDSIAVVRAVTLSHNLEETVSCFNHLLSKEMKHQIDINLNGDLCRVSSNTTIAQLLEQMNIKSTGRVVSMNNDVVTRNQWNSIVVKHNDTISIFSAIAGG